MPDVLKFAAIGDSFTEGLGDERPDGTPRGWADLTAQHIAARQPIEYINLAIRGRTLTPIARDQLDRALALEPDIITFCGGGNDLLRPSYDPDKLAALTECAIMRTKAAGVRMIVMSNANPSRGMAFGQKVNAAGTEMNRIVRDLADKHGVEYVDNFTDTELMRPGYWAPDRLHINAFGHQRVAARLLEQLGYRPPAEWWTPLPGNDPRASLKDQADYYKNYVIPWFWHRICGHSSADGVQPKLANWTPIGTSDPAVVSRAA